jgi:hypothetical protein
MSQYPKSPGTPMSQSQGMASKGVSTGMGSSSSVSVSSSVARSSEIASGAFDSETGEIFSEEDFAELVDEIEAEAVAEPPKPRIRPEKPGLGWYRDHPEEAAAVRAARALASA